MKLKWIEFTSLMLAVLVTGVFWGTWFTLTRSLESFAAAEFIHIGKTIIANVALPMRILMPATLLIMLLAVWQSRSIHKPAFYLYSVSFFVDAGHTHYYCGSGSSYRQPDKNMDRKHIAHKLANSKADLGSISYNTHLYINRKPGVFYMGINKTN